MIHDGHSRTGMSLVDFYQSREIAEQAAKLGLMVPPVSDVDQEAPPALAFVNPLTPVEPVSRWIARCPDCAGGSAYVWIGGPHIMWCLACGNATLEHRWRPVLVPAERLEIERLLLARPLPSQMAWVPGETLARLQADNERLGA